MMERLALLFEHVGYVLLTARQEMEITPTNLRAMSQLVRTHDLHELTLQLLS
jgi:hypothetical protein